MAIGMSNGPSAPKGFEALLTTLVAGLQQLIPAKSTLLVKGVTMTQAQVVSALQAAIAYYSAVRNQKAAMLTALAAREAQSQAARDLYNQIKAALVAQLGKGNPELGKFGFKVGKAPRLLTSAEKALKAARARVTRKLRGTLGSRMKAAIVAATPTLQLGPNGPTLTPNPADVPAPSGTAAAAPPSGGTTAEQSGSAAPGSSNAPAGK